MKSKTLFFHSLENPHLSHHNIWITPISTVLAGVLALTIQSLKFKEILSEKKYLIEGLLFFIFFHLTLIITPISLLVYFIYLDTSLIGIFTATGIFLSSFAFMFFLLVTIKFSTTFPISSIIRKKFIWTFEVVLLFLASGFSLIYLSYNFSIGLSPQNILILLATSTAIQWLTLGFILIKETIQNFYKEVVKSKSMALDDRLGNVIGISYDELSNRVDNTDKYEFLGQENDKARFRASLYCLFLLAKNFTAEYGYFPIRNGKTYFIYGIKKREIIHAEEKKFI